MIKEKSSIEEDFLISQIIANKEILSFKEALVYMSISDSFLYKLTCKREIPFSKPKNGKIYFKKSDLNAFMLSNEQKSKGVLLEEKLKNIQNGLDKGR